MIFTMLNFLKERHKHNFEDVIWYATRYDCGYWLYVYKTLVCTCGKEKSRCVYHIKFPVFNDRKEKINWWVSRGAITEEEFAFKYR